MFTLPEKKPRKRPADAIIADTLRWCLYIEDHPGNNTESLAKKFNVSEMMIIRGRRIIKKLGVDIAYMQYPRKNDKKNGLIIKSWGIFDPEKIRKHLDK